MQDIVTVQEAVTAFAEWLEPTDVELDAIDREMPVIEADIDLLDARIIALDRIPTELDTRRIRRARSVALAMRLVLANQVAPLVPGVGA
jgi:hypothetical protein